MMSEPIRIAVAGASGRLGRHVMGVALNTSAVRLVAGLVRADGESVGRDLGQMAGYDANGVAASDDLHEALEACDVLIDVSVAETAAFHARACAAAKRAYVTGVTGQDAVGMRAIEQAAESTAVVAARNFSVGAAVLEALVLRAASLTDETYQIEVFEAHHGAKRDAPSGTALNLGVAAADGRGVPHEPNAMGRHEGRSGQRPERAIGYAVMRGGGVVGEHQVRLLGSSEQIILEHRVQDRRVFAEGAVRAAQWAHDQPPGLYDMRNVLGLAE